MNKVFTLCFLLVSIGLHAQVCDPNTNSLSLNGTSDCIEFASQNNLNPTTAVTVEAWINASAWGTYRYDNSIYCKHSGYTPSGLAGYALRAGANGTLSFVIGGDSAGINNWAEIYSSTGVLSLNTWTHVAGTFDGTTVSIYKNGVLIGSQAFQGIINSSPCTQKIGRMSDSLQAASRYWNGKIDEVRVFDRALTATEILDSMSVQIIPSAQTGLVGYWRFSDGSGSTITDIGTGNNTGTATGTTWSTSVPFTAAPAIPIIGFSGVQLYTLTTYPNYQWYLDGNIIPGATGQVYNPSQNGTYTLVVSNGACTSTSAPQVITTLSISETDFTKSIQFYPNPATDVLNVKSFDNRFQSIEITDTEGRKVFSKIIESNLTISLSNFAEGIYFAKFISNDGLVVRKFVVGN